MFNGTLVSADDGWMLWTALIVFAAVGIYLEQNFKWAERISGPIIVLMLAVISVNLHILPTTAPTYDAVWTYLVPLSIATLLFRANIRDIIKGTGKLFICFNLSAVGTLLGTIVAFFVFRRSIPEADKLAGILEGSYTGGGVNQFAVAASSNISESIFSAEVVADNFVFALLVLVLLWIPTSKFFLKRFPHPFQDEIDAKGEDAIGKAKTMSAAFWGSKDISLLDIAKVMATAFVEVTVATKLANLFTNLFAAPEGASLLAQLPAMMLGNQYVMITVIAVTLTSVFPKYFENLKGSQEIGTFMIYVFFAAMGCPADIKAVIVNAPLIFVFCALMIIVNMLVTYSTGKLFKQNLEELSVAINACVGGPPSAAAMAIAKGYDKLVVPAILVGLWGYIIGTPLGLFIWHWCSNFMD